MFGCRPSSAVTIPAPTMHATYNLVRVESGNWTVERKAFHSREVGNPSLEEPAMFRPFRRNCSAGIWCWRSFFGWLQVVPFCSGGFSASGAQLPALLQNESYQAPKPIRALRLCCGKA